VSALHDPQLLALALSEYCISYPVIGLSVGAVMLLAEMTFKFVKKKKN
jgi:hypothetical protein